MLYTGLTERELKKITGILDQHGARYEAQIVDGPRQDERYARRANAHFEVVIEKEEFTKITSDGLAVLARLNIFPDMFEEDFQVDEAPLKVEKKGPDGYTRILGILGLIFMLYMAVTWVDAYVIRIYPQKGNYYPSTSKRIFHQKLIDW